MNETQEWCHKNAASQKSDSTAIAGLDLMTQIALKRALKKVSLPHGLATFFRLQHALLQLLFNIQRVKSEHACAAVIEVQQQSIFDGLKRNLIPRNFRLFKKTGFHGFMAWVKVCA